MQKPPLKLIVQKLFFLLVFLFIFSSILGIFNVESVDALSCSKTTYTTRGPIAGAGNTQASACTSARASANSIYQCITSSCTNQPLGCLYLVMGGIPTYVCTCNTTCTKCQPSTQTWSCPSTQCVSCTYYYNGVSCGSSVGYCVYGSSQANSPSCGSSCGGGSNPTPRPTPAPTPACPTTAPTGLSPANGTTYPAGTTQATIDWNSVPGAAWYNIRVTDGVGDVYDSRNNCTTNTPYVCINNNGGATIFTFAVRNGRTYNWTIIPNNTGCGGGPTGGGNFSVANPTPPPTPAPTGSPNCNSGPVYGACSATCGGGTQTCTYTTYSGGGACNQVSCGTPACNTQACPTPTPTPTCDSGTSCGACSVSSPSCGTGSQTCTYTTLSAGGECTPTSFSQSCSATCSPGSSCISNACVCDEPATPTGLAPDGMIPAGLRNITWNAVAGVNAYALRIDDLSTPWSNDCGITQYGGDICNNNVTATSYAYTFVTGHSYSVWVHAISAVCGRYSPAASTSPFVGSNLTINVYNDYNGNGFQDAPDTANSGQQVTITGEGAQSYTTNGLARTISNLNPGSSEISVALPSGWTTTANNPVTVTYPPPTAQTVNIGIRPPAPTCSGGLTANPTSVNPGGTSTLTAVGCTTPTGTTPTYTYYDDSTVAGDTTTNTNTSTSTFTAPAPYWTETIVNPSVTVCNPGGAGAPCSNYGTTITIVPVFSIAGNVFTDANKNQLKDAGESNYSPISITSTPQSGQAGGSVTTDVPGGTFSVNNLPRGEYTISYTSLPSGSGYQMTMPINGPPPFFTVNVGTGCSIGSSNSASCDVNNNIINLNFGITNSIPWCQFSGGGDIGGDGGFSCSGGGGGGNTGGGGTDGSGGGESGDSCVYDIDCVSTLACNTSGATCTCGTGSRPGTCTLGNGGADGGGTGGSGTLCVYDVDCVSGLTCNTSGSTCTCSAGSTPGSCAIGTGGAGGGGTGGTGTTGGFNDPIPSTATAVCGGPYASVPGNTSITPGLIFTGNGSAYFGQGSASLNNWLVGGTNYPESFGPVNQGGLIKTSYAYLQSIAKQANITPIDLNSDASFCSFGGLANCKLSPTLPHGIYVANGNLTLTGNGTPANYTFPSNQNYIILVSGNLTIQTQLHVPDVPVGSTALFSASGDIIVDKSIGATGALGYQSSTPHIEGIFSADRSFIINGQNDCTIGPDLKINVAGSIITNAALLGGTFTNQRDLCANNVYCPVFTIQSRPDFILNAPSFVKKANRTWQEVAP